MGICINYMIRKKKGEPNTAVICTSLKEFQEAVKLNGYIRSENERFYGENDTHKVKFSKTSGPRTERGEFLNDHINLCDELEELNAKGYLEVVYDEEKYFQSRNLGILRKSHASYQKTNELIMNQLQEKGWSKKTN